MRCGWARNDLAIRYHDEEWGVPVHDDPLWFEFITLEGAQAGLSWDTILRKREAYRNAFKDFEPARVAKFGDRDVARLLADTGIVRNRLEDQFDDRQRESFRRRAERVRQLRRLRLALRRRAAAD